MHRERIKQAIEAEVGSGSDADQILKYVEDDAPPADKWSELVLIPADDTKTMYSERFGNLVFNWKEAIVDGVPAILDVLNPNPVLAILKIGRAYRTLVNLFHVDLGEDEAKVVKALWLDIPGVAEVTMNEVQEATALPAQRADAALRNLERLKVVSRTALGRILRRDSIRILGKPDRAGST